MVILRYTSGAVAERMFAVALSVYKVAQGLFTPLSWILFLRFSHLFHHDHNVGVRIHKRILLFHISLLIVFSALLAWSVTLVLPFLISHKFYALVYLFQLMCMVPVLNSVSNLIGL